jgi:hypothetical protein
VGQKPVLVIMVDAPNVFVRIVDAGDVEPKAVGAGEQSLLLRLMMIAENYERAA